jgi:hypothetical protein
MNDTTYGGNAMEGAPVLTRDAVAKILGVLPKSVSQYLVESKEGGKYASRPFPAPDGRIGRSPWWQPSRETEIRAWADGRVGRGVGGGRPSHATN